MKINAAFAFIATLAAWHAAAGAGQDPYGCPSSKIENGGSAQAEVKVSCDPNEMAGPAGAGEKRYVKKGEWMDYTIYFENYETASAAAIKIAVSLPKDANLDWTTLELGEVAFGEHVDGAFAENPSARSSRYSLAGSGCEVRTEVDETGEAVQWFLRIWDPATSDHFPDDFMTGILPPNDETGRGEGHLRYRVKVKDSAPAGARINASASIVFDDNPAIETDPAWWNTVAETASVAFEGVDGAREYIVGEAYGELPDPGEKTGHAFAGWFTGPGGTGEKILPSTIVKSGTAAIYAFWTANVCTVVFDAAGGTCSEDKRQIAYGGKLGTLPEAVREGWNFTGWFLEGAKVEKNFTVTAGITLVAGWEEVEAEVRSLYPEGDAGEIPFSAATVWDGFIIDAGGAVRGTLQVKFAKAKLDKKTGELSAKISATVVLAGEKKAAVKGQASFGEDGTASFEGEDKAARALHLAFAGRSMTGAFDGLAVEGARNLFVSKDAADKAGAAHFLATSAKPLNIVWPGGAISAAPGAKGKVKLTGSTAAGAKISLSAQTVIGEKWSAIPAANPKDASMAFAIWLANDGSATEVAGLEGARAGRPGEIREGLVFSTGAADGEVALFLKNGKPTAPKADKLKAIDGTIVTTADNGNPLALKFSYTPKTGAFKGSFTIFEIVEGKLKKQAAKFTGVFIDGAGYGTAIIKKLGLSWPVIVK